MSHIETSPPIAAAATSSHTLSKDIAASLVVFLMAVPLALGIALASGAPSVLPGLIGCVVGGIVVGALGGPPLQVSGSAAGLTIIVYGIVQKYGWSATCLVTVGAGLFQLLFGWLRVARICLAITPAVVHGMLAGIGVVTALAQLHIVLGGTPENSALKNLHDLPAQILDLHTHAAFLGLLTIAILFAWERVPKKIRTIPGALIAVLVTTLIANVFWFDVKRVALPDNIAAGFAFPKLPEAAEWSGLLIAMLTVAMVASVESLLSAVATDKLHDGPRANLDRELVGQGAGNTLSGLLGGLPITGVIVRSSANITAGAQTRLSSILHGVWIILFVLFFSALLEKVPLSTLAGLLVYVGIRLIKLNDIRELHHHREAVVYFTTLFGVTFLNLLTGVGLGIALSVFMLLRKLATTNVTVTQQKDRWHARIDGSVSFVSVPVLSASLAKIPPGAKVDVDLMVDFMDHAGFEALHNWRQTHERLGGSVDIDERHEAWYENAVNGTPMAAHGGRRNLFGGLPSLFRRNNRTENHDDLMKGVVEFQEAANTARPVFTELAQGQSPNFLFIGCADSRVVPDFITASSPGALFAVRNIGNLVPHKAEVLAEGRDTSVLAAIEYALDVLKIENIIVCGHSECGAMNALSDQPDPAVNPGIVSWLQNAQSTQERFAREGGLDKTLSVQNQLAQINVLEQLAHLKTYPKVQAALAEDRLHLWGWYFDIEKAEVFLYRPDQQQFVPMDQNLQTVFA